MCLCVMSGWQSIIQHSGPSPKAKFRPLVPDCWLSSPVAGRRSPVGRSGSIETRPEVCQLHCTARVTHCSTVTRQTSTKMSRATRVGGSLFAFLAVWMAAWYNVLPEGWVSADPRVQAMIPVVSSLPSHMHCTTAHAHSHVFSMLIPGMPCVAVPDTDTHDDVSASTLRPHCIWVLRTGRRRLQPARVS